MNDIEARPYVLVIEPFYFLQTNARKSHADERVILSNAVPRRINFSGHLEGMDLHLQRRAIRIRPIKHQAKNLSIVK
jgi:hypothetical protein